MCSRVFARPPGPALCLGRRRARADVHEQLQRVLVVDEDGPACPPEEAQRLVVESGSGAVDPPGGKIPPGAQNATGDSRPEWEGEPAKSTP